MGRLTRRTLTRLMLASLLGSLVVPLTAALPADAAPHTSVRVAQVPGGVQHGLQLKVLGPCWPR
jgi:hypothetical protein